MTLPQKQIIRELIELSVQSGFGCRYPLSPIAKKLGITELLYDGDTETGILWELGSHGKGYIDISHDGKYAGIYYQMVGMLENWVHRNAEPKG